MRCKGGGDAVIQAKQYILPYPCTLDSVMRLKNVLLIGLCVVKCIKHNINPTGSTKNGCLNLNGT